MNHLERKVHRSGVTKSTCTANLEQINKKNVRNEAKDEHFHSVSHTFCSAMKQTTTTTITENVNRKRRPLISKAGSKKIS